MLAVTVVTITFSLSGANQFGRIILLTFSLEHKHRHSPLGNIWSVIPCAPFYSTSTVAQIQLRVELKLTPEQIRYFDIECPSVAVQARFSLARERAEPIPG